MLSQDRDSDSEFGYDFSPEDEEALSQLASIHDTSAGTRQTEPSSVIDALPGKTDSVAGDDVASTIDDDDIHHIPSAQVGGVSQGRATLGRTARRTKNQATHGESLLSPVSIAEDVAYPDLSRALSNVDGAAEAPKPLLPVEKTEGDPFDDDGRSPLQKFRSYPRKPLTVTDLNSGAWCELQYAYTLTRLPGGRRTRTKAMRQGSKVHQKLEDEVHTTVKVEVLTKEDGFGLRLWNLIQGLRTLRDNGLTRELEVWGMVDGNLVNGVIDSVSYENPNPEFEQELSSQESQMGPQQSKLVDYFPPKRKGKKAKTGPKIYLTDVKTRGSATRVSNALLRPAKIQLLLYHRFLSDMAAGKLDYLKVLRRYGLDADDPFSDAFVAQIGSLHDEIFVDAPSSSAPETSSYGDEQSSQAGPQSSATDHSAPPGPDLVKYNCLRELLTLVKQEVELTFPEQEDSLGHMLRIQYIYRVDGRELDLHDFPVSKQALEDYLTTYMAWWRGEREAKGVDIEEAFKCSTCEFASDCSWRQDMDEELVRRARQKKVARQESGRIRA